MKKILFSILLLLGTQAHADDMLHIRTVVFFDVQPGIAQEWATQFPEQACIPNVMLATKNPFLVAQISEVSNSSFSLTVVNVGDVPLVGMVKIYYSPCATEEY